VTALTYDDFTYTLRRAAARRAAPPLRILTAADAALAVRHAADEGLDVELGRDPADSALVLDLSRMKRIVIDFRKRLVRAQPGVTARELDQAVTRHGLEVGELVAADVVWNDGSIVRASEESAELLQRVRLRTVRGFVVDSTYRLRDAA
jgi:hypothetical protein